MSAVHRKPRREGRADAGSRRRKGRGAPRLTVQLARTDPELAAQLAETRVRADNPLRRVRVGCCVGWRRDADATVGTWVWCAEHADFTRVLEVAE